MAVRFDRLAVEPAAFRVVPLRPVAALPTHAPGIRRTTHVLESRLGTEGTREARTSASRDCGDRLAARGCASRSYTVAESRLFARRFSRPS
jgi:hypothetical protein